MLIFAIHHTPLNAQTNQDKCVRKCARDAKTEIRDCRKLSKQRINDNIDDIFTVFDYCTDSFVGSCESVVNGNYRSCIMDICGIDFVDYWAFTEFDPKEDPVSDFLDAFVPLFTKQIAETLKEPVKETLNDLIPTLPFPESCSSE